MKRWLSSIFTAVAAGGFVGGLALGIIGIGVLIGAAIATIPATLIWGALIILGFTFPWWKVYLITLIVAMIGRILLR